EGARGGMRHGIAAFGLLTESSTVAASAWRAGRGTYQLAIFYGQFWRAFSLGLSRRPREFAPAHQMHVHVKHRLAWIKPDVQDCAIAIFDSPLLPHARCRKMAVPRDFRVLEGSFL